MIKTFEQGDFQFTLTAILPSGKQQPIQLTVTSQGPAAYFASYTPISQTLPAAITAAMAAAQQWATDRGSNTDDHDYLLSQGFADSDT